MSSYHLWSWKERKTQPWRLNREKVQVLNTLSRHELPFYIGTQILRCSTGFGDGAILKPGEIEITKNYFFVVVLCVVHQIFQLKNTQSMDAKEMAEELSKQIFNIYYHNRRWCELGPSLSTEFLSSSLYIRSLRWKESLDHNALSLK